MGSLAVGVVVGAVVVGAAAPGVQAAPVAGVTQQGRATMNSLGESGLGNCGYPPEVIADRMYTAAQPAEYDSSAGCGTYLDVTGVTGRTVRVLLADKCPECEPGHLDMSPESFRAIAPQAGGVQQISYVLVRDPVLPAPIAVRVQTGATAYWIGFQVMNHGNQLVGVDYRDADGAWQPLRRSVYNYWQKQDGAGPGPFTLRLTDVTGRRVEVADIRLEPDVVQDTGVWMYHGGSPAPDPSVATPQPSRSASEAALPCAAETRMDGSWPDGYQALLTVRNDGPETLKPWRVHWSVPAGVTVTAWNGTLVQDGGSVTVTAPDYAEGLAPGESVGVGFRADGAPSPAATVVDLNGAVCATGLS